MTVGNAGQPDWQRLAEDFRLGLAVRLEGLLTRWHGDGRPPHSQAPVLALQRQLESLVACAGEIGADELGDKLRSLRDYLLPLLDAEPDIPPSQRQWTRVAHRLRELRDLADRLTAPTEAPPEPVAERPLIIPLTRQLARPDFVASLAEVDVEVASEAQCQALRQSPVRQSPAGPEAGRAGPSNASFPARLETGRNLLIIADLEQLATLVHAGTLPAGRMDDAHSPTIWVLAAQGSADFDTQSGVQHELEAMRLGAQAVFPASLTPAALAERVRDWSTASNTLDYRILMVDDSEAQGLFAETLLNAAGMCVRRLVNPLEILKHVESFDPDVLLLDLHMPQANGLEIAALIRARSNLQRLPIVFLSGETDPELQAKALVRGGDDFLEKPIRPKQLTALLANRARVYRELRAAQESHGQNALDSEPITRPETEVPNVDEGADSTAASGTLLSQGAALKRLNQLWTEAALQGIAYVRFENSDEVREPLEALIVNAFSNGAVIGRYGSQGYLLVIASNERVGWSEHTGRLQERVSSVREAVWAQHKRLITPLLGTAAVTSALSNPLELLQQAEASLHPVGRAAPETGLWGTRLRRFIDVVDQRAFIMQFAPLVTLQGKRRPRFVAQLSLNLDGDVLDEDQIHSYALDAKLSARVDSWCLSHALRTLKRNWRANHDLSLFVRLSAAALENPQLAHWLVDALNQARLPSRSLVLLFAAEQLATRLKLASTALDTLSEIGIHAGVAEAGRVSNPFLLVRHLNTRYIAFEPETTAGLRIGSERAKTLKLSIDTARSMQQAVIATAGDANGLGALWHLGVDLITGPFISAPLSQPEFAFDRFYMPSPPTEAVPLNRRASSNPAGP